MPLRNGCTCARPSSTLRSPGPTLRLPAGAQAGPEGLGLAGAGAGLRARRRRSQQLRQGEEKGGSLHRGKETLGRQRGRKTFSRKKLLQFPPYIPSCEWLGRRLSAGLASPSAPSPPSTPQLLLPGGSGKARGTVSFSKALLTSLSLQHVLPCFRLGGKKVCKSPMHIRHQELCKPCGREAGISLDPPHFHTQI